MDTESVERSRIQKLSGPNYRNWAIQIEIELIDRKVWSAIDPTFRIGLGLKVLGKDETPEAAAEREEELVYFRNNRARRIILECCTPAVMNRVISFKTAKGVWDELRRIYARDGLQQLDRKNEAFASYLPPATTQVVDVAVMLNQLQDEIGEMDIEERPGDSKKTSRFLTIMRARGGDYKMAAAQARLARVTDFKDIIDYFVDIEEQIKEAKPVTESAQQASTDTGNTRGKGGGRGGRGKSSQKDTHTCYHCGKTGHIRRDCNAKKRGEPKTAGPSTGPLAAPGGGKGLSPPPPEEANAAGIQAASTTETSWIAAVNGLCGVDTRWASDIQVQSKAWIMDSGCSRHMTYAKEAFVDYIALDKSIPVRLANGTEIQAVAEGTVSFEIAVKGGKRRIQLHEVLHVPKLAGSLVSVPHLQDKGIMTRTTSGGKMLLELRGQVIGVANRIGRSYVLDGT
jgi:hypothetical protein